ncbi:hypothetical protein HMI49_11850 [Corallococcus exercitus]|uniref:Lipoprotein n=1 Tax=Corallococcus exercitus TaxID=2316736 RepID=A0A7Y4NS65_9BACT|nr:hypothetical protein [Corallococcus exercitus]NOK33893.1 hypothetical protein [Corallococcus exercitus]
MKASTIAARGLLLLLGACTGAHRTESPARSPKAEEPSKYVRTDSLGTRTCFAEDGETWPDLFPRGALALNLGPHLDMSHRSQELLELEQCWCSYKLLALKEDSLLPLAPDSEVYRFTWMPSFEPYRLIRVEHRGSVYSLHVKEEGNSKGALAVDRRILLTPTQWQALQHRLEQARFWTLDRFAPPNSLVYLDGSQWLFEGGRKGRYRALDIQSPEPDGRAGALYGLGAFMMELAGLPMDRNALY